MLYGEPTIRDRRSGRAVDPHGERNETCLAACVGDRPQHALRAQLQRTLSPNDQRARDIFEQLININTTGSSGSTTVAANAMASDCSTRASRGGRAGHRAPGLEESQSRGAVAEYGNAKADPVARAYRRRRSEARRLVVDPFTLLEKDGFFYGRGTLDVKDVRRFSSPPSLALKQERLSPQPRPDSRPHNR